MGKAIEKKEDRVAGLIDEMKGEFAKVLPRWITAERMARVVLTEFRKVPKLMDCTKVSLLKCVMQSAELGLEPGSALNQAYLIPYKDECTLIIGYRGLLELARRSGQIKDIYGEVVYENDEFDYALGLNPKLDHKPALKSRGDPIFAYAVAHLKDGGIQFEVMSVEEINKIRDVAMGKMKGRKDAPWVAFWGPMAIKTVLRRLCKYLPAAILPREVQDTLAVEDEKFYDTTATRMSEQTAKSAEDLKVRLRKTKTKSEPAQAAPATESSAEQAGLTEPDDALPAEEKPKRKFVMTAGRIHILEETAMSNGWPVEKLHEWIAKDYGAEKLKDIQDEETYMKILAMVKELGPDDV